MRTHKQQPNDFAAPVRRAIPASAPRIERTPCPAAAAARELTAFAADVQRFMNDSKLSTILRGVRRDIDRSEVPAT
jgi:hypothetical protein